MTNDVPLRPMHGLKDLLRALAQLGQLAEAMLAEQEVGPVEVRHEVPRAALVNTRPRSVPSATPSEPESYRDAGTSRPVVWRGTPPAIPRPFFTKHAADRLHGSYGIAHTNMAQTMAALSHQIHGTHMAGLEAVHLGKRLLSDGAPGTIWAVEIFHQVGFVVTDEDGVIVSALPRDSHQLSALPAPRRAALETFRDELRIRYADPVYLARYQRRSPLPG